MRNFQFACNFFTSLHSVYFKLKMNETITNFVNIPTNNMARRSRSAIASAM